MEETKKAFIFVVSMLACIGATGSLTVFLVVLSEEVIEKEIEMLDQLIIELLLLTRNSFLNSTMALITELGSFWFLAFLSLLIIVILWLKYKDKWAIFFLIWTVGGGGLLNILLKNLFERDRPSGDAIVNAEGFSFPSGHAMMSLIAYGFLIYLVVRYSQKKIIIGFTGIFMVILIIMIGFSRIYLEVHYPSDVLSGFLAGQIWLLISLMAFEWIIWRRTNEKASVKFLIESVKFYIRKLRK